MTGADEVVVRIERGAYSAELKIPPAGPASLPAEKKRAKISGTLVTFLVLLAVVGGLLWLAMQLQQPALFSILAGALGGLIHEIFQTGGLVALPRRLEDGELYLGSVGGLVTGAVAGLGAMSLAPDTATHFSPTIGVAGFALKSTAEAGVSFSKVTRGLLQG
jgi:hypothetical protein